MLNSEEKVCPLCGKDNNCLHNKDCWCMDREIPKKLIEQIAIEKRGRSCICESCVDEYEKNNKKSE